MRNISFAGAMALLLAVIAARPFIGVLVWCWISFMNPHQMAWGWASDMPWALMVFAATLFGCVVAREPSRMPWNGMVALTLALILCVSVASFFALSNIGAVQAKWERTVKMLISLLLIAALLTDRRRIHAIVWVMVISIGYFGVKGGAFSLATGGAFRVFGPPATMIEDNNHIAAALLVTLPLMNYLRLQSRHRIVWMGLVVAMGLSLLSIVASYSRGALIGLTAVGLFLWFTSPGKLKAALVLVAAIGAAIMFMPDAWLDRMSSIQHYNQDESSMGRLTIWRAAWAIAVARPLTGGGFLAPYTQAIVDQFAPGVEARAVHSIYFEILGENGFPAFFVWLAMSGYGLLNARSILRATRNTPELAWARDLARMAIVSVIAYLVAGTFLSLSYWDFYLTFLTVLAATRDRVRDALAASAQRDSPQRLRAGLRPRVA